jgi:hypothetical protein
VSAPTPILSSGPPIDTIDHPVGINFKKFTTLSTTLKLLRTDGMMRRNSNVAW